MAAKECGFTNSVPILIKNSRTSFLKIEKLDKFVTDVGRQFHICFKSLVKNCEFLDVSTTGMHSIITGCSCVMSMDLSVCQKQIEEEWRQRIIVVAKHKFSSIQRVDLENI